MILLTWQWGIVITAIGVMGMLGFSHWAIGKATGGREIHRIWAYIAGVTIVGLGFSGWAVAYGFWPAAVAYWAFFACGGAIVILTYWLDHLADIRELEARRDQAHDEA